MIGIQREEWSSVGARFKTDTKFTEKLTLETVKTHACALEIIMNRISETVYGFREEGEVPTTGKPASRKKSKEKTEKPAPKEELATSKQDGDEIVVASKAGASKAGAAKTEEKDQSFKETVKEALAKEEEKEKPKKPQKPDPKEEARKALEEDDSGETEPWVQHPTLLAVSTYQDLNVKVKLGKVMCVIITWHKKVLEIEMQSRAAIADIYGVQVAMPWMRPYDGQRVPAERIPMDHEVCLYVCVPQKCIPHTKRRTRRKSSNWARSARSCRFVVVSQTHTKQADPRSAMKQLFQTRAPSKPITQFMGRRNITLLLNTDDLPGAGKKGGQGNLTLKQAAAQRHQNHGGGENALGDED